MGKTGSGAVLDSLAKGNLTTAQGSNASQQWTAGTEKILRVLGSDTLKTIVVYYNETWMFWDSTNAQHLPYEWFLVRMDDDATAPNMNDTAVRERLMRDKRIFDRGFSSVNPGSYMGPSVVKVKLFNVTLEEGEWIMLFILPLVTAAGATMRETYRTEYRVITL